jgi:hypothetical protein
MCREASRARRKKSYQENPEKFRHLAREFAAANPIKRKSQYLRWKAENPEKVNVHVERMTNAYVAYALKMRVADASPELLALKREQLTIHRLSRQLKQATKPTKESP